MTCNLYILFSVYLAYMASPAHIELIVEEKSSEIAKAAEVETEAPRVTRKRAAQLRGKVAVGGGH